MNNYSKLMKINKKRFQTIYQLRLDDTAIQFVSFVMGALDIVTLLILFVSLGNDLLTQRVFNVSHILLENMLCMLAIGVFCFALSFSSFMRIIFRLPLWSLQYVLHPEAYLKGSLEDHAVSMKSLCKSISESSKHLEEETIASTQVLTSKNEQSLSVLEAQLERERLCILAAKTYGQLQDLIRLVNVNEEQIAEIAGISNSINTLKFVQEELIPELQTAKIVIKTQESSFTKLEKLGILPYEFNSESQRKLKTQKISVLKLKTAILKELDSNEDLAVLEDNIEPACAESAYNDESETISTRTQKREPLDGGIRGGRAIYRY